MVAFCLMCCYSLRSPHFQCTYMWLFQRCRMFLSSEVIRVCVQQLNLALQNRCLVFSAWRQCFFRLHRSSGQYLCSLRVSRGRGRWQWHQTSPENGGFQMQPSPASVIVLLLKAVIRPCWLSLSSSIPEDDMV
jgi:hypothetical protein